MSAKELNSLRARLKELEREAKQSDEAAKKLKLETQAAKARTAFLKQRADRVQRRLAHS